MRGLKGSRRVDANEPVWRAHQTPAEPSQALPATMRRAACSHRELDLVLTAVEDAEGNHVTLPADLVERLRIAAAVALAYRVLPDPDGPIPVRSSTDAS